MENHQGNHRQFQPTLVPVATTTALSFSEDHSDSNLPRSQTPSVAHWTLGPGPIKPPVLILPDISTEKALPPPSRPRSRTLIPPESARKTTRSRLLWTITSILAVLGVIVGVTWINTKAVADVMLFQVNRPHTTQTIGGSGIVYPRQRFDLSYPATEQVLEVLVKAGDQVTPDQALVRLSHHGLLTSPIRGVVTVVNINPGETFSANTLLLTVMDETMSIVHTKLPLSTFGQVTPGLAAEVTSSALPGRTFEGTVSSVIPQADPQTGTFEAWIRIDNQKEMLLPGTKVSVRIIRAQ